MANAPKAHKGLGMEGVIASWYAWQAAGDSDEFERTARRIAAHLSSDAHILEVAPGPGYLAIALAKLTGCQVTGIDISRSFVRMARDNSRKAGVNITVQRGDAAALPFTDGQFDFVVCRAAFKSFTRPLVALDEMYRVLKPGGTALIIDLRKDYSSQAMNDHVRGKSAFSAIIIKLTCNTTLRKRAYSTETLTQLVSQSQFRQGEFRPQPFWFELWLRKRENGGVTHDAS